MKVFPLLTEKNVKPASFPAEMTARLKTGDPIAFKHLYDGYCRKLYAFGYSHFKCNLQAEELVHDVLVKIWENRQHLNESLPLEPYLFRIAKNLVLDTFRKNAAESLYRKYAHQEQAPGHNQTEEDIDFADLERLSREAIAKLPPVRQLIFTMSRQHALSYAEIAAQLNISAKTVEAQMTKALKQLKHYLRADIGVILLLMIY